MRYKIELIKALQSLQQSAKEFDTFLEHGTLSVELYKPDKIDNQHPHERDEVYIIATGEGKFKLNNQITHVQAGDFLFVPAKTTHKFIDFTNDFSTWVLFYGPKEGEKGSVKNYLSYDG